MSSQNPTSDEATERLETDRVRRRAGSDRPLASAVRDGRLHSLAGGTLLALAARSVRRDRRHRAGALGLVGAALLGTGIRRRRSWSVASGAGASADDRGGAGASADRESSAEAAAHRTASDLVSPDETSPRGVADEPDVETETEPDEGRVRFSTEHDEGEHEARPQLEDSEEGDPRVAEPGDPGVEDDHVDVSLSTTEMTDELGKVAGPEDEQAFPTSEGTDPEPMPEEAPPRTGEGAVANRGPDEGASAGEDEPSEGDESAGDAGSSMADAENESPDEAAGSESPAEDEAEPDEGAVADEHAAADEERADESSSDDGDDAA